MKVQKENRMMFTTLELNKKMKQVATKQEQRMFRCMSTYERLLIDSEEQFRLVLADAKQLAAAINSARIGRGHYLHVDGAMPTDRTDGWIKITYLDVRKAQARIEILRCQGELTSEE